MENNEKELSLSKQRKLDRKKAIAKQKRSAVTTKLIAALVIVVVVGLIVWGVCSSVSKKNKELNANPNYSEYIGEDGMIKGVKAADIVDLCDYSNITVPSSELAYSDEEVDKDIASIRESHQELVKDEPVVVKDGDKVNIDYVGSVDGVEFKGGNSGGTGADLVIGSHTFIDTFEEQIIGHVPGDEFDVNVTFPDPYENDAELSGKAAVFKVTLNGVYTVPEFDDAFVAENLSENAKTVEEYRAYIKQQKHDEKLDEFITSYLTENCSVSDYPSDYTKQLKGNYKFQEQSNYEYMNQLYQSYYGSTPYATFEDYTGKTDEEYNEGLFEIIEPSLKLNLVLQAIAEKEGITADYDEFKAYYVEKGGSESDIDSQLQTYGKGYLVETMLCTKVLDFVKSHVSEN